MGVAVCCPTCWKWSELKGSTACRRCGTPLVLADGRPAEQVALAQAGAIPPLPPPFAFNAHMATLGPPAPVGFNWVALARWITIAYGALLILGLLATGFIVEYVNIPVQNPATGQIIDQTVNIRPFLLGAAIAVAVVFALFAWLTGYVVARVVFLVLIALGTVSALARLAGEPASAVAGTLVAVACDAAFGFVLVMSLLAPQRTVS